MTNTAKSLPPLPTAEHEQAEGCVDRDRVAKDLERLKWLLWHGNTFRADQVLSWLEDDLDSEDPGETQRKLAKYLAEFAGYIRANTAWIPNYGERRRCGEAISSAFVESTVNQVVSKADGQKTANALVTDRGPALPTGSYPGTEQRPGHSLPAVVSGLHPPQRPGRTRRIASPLGR
jgi:hypothetical protein